MSHRFRTVVALSLAATFAVSACGGGDAVDNVDSFTKKLSWGDCTGKDAPDDPYECATVTVPVDYRKADGDTMKIALVRLPASEGKAKGIILTNPGGPGGSGIEFMSWAGRELADSLSLQKFDIVGFDPRGVGKSGGVRCMTDEELDNFLYLDSTPDTPEEKKLDYESDKFDTACTDKYGTKLQNYSTEYTARDMDIIRASMGFEKTHYLGISYGTYLGAVYATLFPDRVASMFLDSAFDPQGDSLEQEYTTQAVGFEKAFKNWITWCESNKEDCAFHSQDVKQAWTDLYDQLDKKSLVDDGRDVNHRVLNVATKSALYAESQWGQLARALLNAQQGKGAGLLELADNYNDRNEDGTYSSQNDAFYVIDCASGMGRGNPDNPEEFVKKLKKVAPWYYRELEVDDFTGDTCEEGFGSPKLQEISYSGTAPIVVLGGKNDPATPFRWAEEMATSLGENARLLAFSGEGHSQILVSECVDTIAGALFNSGKLPAKGKVCQPDQPMEQPSWWSETVSIVGTEVNAEVFNNYFGLKDTKAYAQYFAVNGSVSDVFKSVAASLKSKGLQYSEGEETDPTKAGQWFYDGVDTNRFVGILITSQEELKKYSMVEPDGIVPAGHLVVAAYYYP
jgi:pimeloyl-ACP methyl ester carboxylesterase